MKRPGVWLLLSGIAAFLGMFLLWPLAEVFVQSSRDEHGWTARYLAELVRNPLQLEAIGNSLLIAIWVTVGCVAVALPVAWLFARRTFAGKPLLGGLLLVPMILPPFVGAVGMRTLLARSGPLSTILMRFGVADGPVDWTGAYPLVGIVILEVLHLFPILYLNLVAALANVDPTLEEAARNLGAPPWRVFTRVTVPLSAPGFFAGCVLIFVWSFTELGTPLVFGVRNVLPVKIFDNVSEIGTNPIGYAQVVLVLVVTAVGFWVSKRFTRRGRDVATLGRLSQAAREKEMRLPGTLAVWILVGGLVLIASLPHVSIVLLASSRRWFLTVLPEGFTSVFYRTAISYDMTRRSLLNSMGLSLCATFVDIVLGFSIAWLCVRSKLRGADWLDALAMLPLAVPGMVIAFGYMGCFPRVFHGTLLDPRHNPMVLLAMSYAVRRLPYMVRACHSGLEQVSDTYEEAAANLGATPLRVIRRVTLPLIQANLLAGAILCFSFSMLEVSDSLILAQSEQHYPITKAIYVLIDALESGVNVASALGVWSMLLLASGLIWASCLLGKRAGQMFRVG